MKVAVDSVLRVFFRFQYFNFLIYATFPQELLDYLSKTCSVSPALFSARQFSPQLQVSMLCEVSAISGFLWVFFISEAKLFIVVLRKLSAVSFPSFFLPPYLLVLTYLDCSRSLRKLILRDSSYPAQGVI